MSESNDTAQAESPTRRRTAAKPTPAKRERSSDLKARMNFAVIALRRALPGALNEPPDRKLVELALDTLLGSEAAP